MIATVHYGTETYAIAKTEQGKRVFVRGPEIPADEVGRRYLVRGEQIEFDWGMRPGPDGKPREQAVNVKLLSQRAPVDTEAHIEEGAVQKVSGDGDFCFVGRKDCGENAFLHVSNVQQCESKYEDGTPYFFVGQVWTYRVTPPVSDKHTAWLAVNARELCAEQSDTPSAPQNCFEKVLQN
jgi:cold shock CspA family protein